MSYNSGNNEFSGSGKQVQITVENTTVDIDLQLFRKKCAGDPPTALEIVGDLDSTNLIIHLVLIVMAFTTVAIFVEEIFYLRSKIRRNYRRRRMSILQAGIPPTFTLTAAVGTFFPRGNLMIDFVCSVYFGFAMHALLNLMVNYYGGITAMLQRLDGVKVRLSTPPLCCCCRCIPMVPMTRTTFKFLYCLTFQAAAGRPIVLFFRGVFVLDPTFSVNELIFTIILAASMLTGMWSLIILRGVSSKVLKHFNITAKFFCFQISSNFPAVTVLICQTSGNYWMWVSQERSIEFFRVTENNPAVMLISNIQPFILKLAKLPCVPPYTTRGRIITVNYQIMIVEFFLISLLMRCLYRTKSDAEDLEDVEKRNEGEIKTSNDTKTLLVESEEMSIELEDMKSTPNGDSVRVIEDV